MQHPCGSQGSDSWKRNSFVKPKSRAETMVFQTIPSSEFNSQVIGLDMNSLDLQGLRMWVAKVPINRKSSLVDTWANLIWSALLKKFLLPTLIALKWNSESWINIHDFDDIKIVWKNQIFCWGFQLAIEISSSRVALQRTTRLLQIKVSF